MLKAQLSPTPRQPAQGGHNPSPDTAAGSLDRIRNEKGDIRRSRVGGANVAKPDLLYLPIQKKYTIPRLIIACSLMLQAWRPQCS